MNKKFTNDLIHETSPYLLQHAHNPVDWKAWNNETLEKAKREQKLIIVSIGYAACHWCHVMEHESFEDEEVALVMNSHYLNIKVDREERPDIDQVYMSAIQILTQRGGWPLNVVCLPDGRPFWGGTYFKKEQWISALTQIVKVYKASPQKIEEYAANLEKGIKSIDAIKLNSDPAEFSIDVIQNAVSRWSQSFDSEKGGHLRAPKFMMPNNYKFLLRYAKQTNNKSLLDYVNLTLTKMAFGGIFDQIGGGFSRYSVDTKWHIPHFEKMLYDNAQLVSLYSAAYSATKYSLYKSVVYQTLEFINRELTTPDGIFYSSLDADSLNKEGKLEEGAFYVWSKEELKSVLKHDYKLFSDYYNINDYGYWEHENYVLIRNESQSEFASKHKISARNLEEKVSSWRELLQKTRNKRSRPRLDDKSLTSWNALMLKAYIDAYKVFNEDRFLRYALKNAAFLSNIQLQPDGRLYHNYKNGKSTINGYLEDYATTIDAFISLYQVTFEEKWLSLSRDLSNYVFDHFYDSASNMFFFTSNLDAKLVSRTIEYRDNVIASSNSIMAKNLFKLSHLLGNKSYLKTAITMLNNIKPEILDYASGFSNWMDLLLNFTNKFYEVAIVGQDALKKAKALNKKYLPNIILAGSKTKSDLPLLKDRFKNNSTLIYVCQDRTCQMPNTSIKDTLKNIE